MRRLLLPLVAGIALAGAACGSGAPPGAPAGQAASTTASTTAAAGDAAPAPATGHPAPLTFTAPGVLGGEVSGAALAGRDVVLWFWSPW